MIFIYITFSSKQEAEKLSQQLVIKRLAACVNIWPIKSVYKWQGRIRKAKEWAGLIKTRQSNYKKVENFILKNHSYDTPCVIEIPINKINKKYSAWLNACLK